MLFSRRTHPRRAAVLPLIVISLLALFGFVALAIDIGIVAIARCQCQNAADAAATAGARTLNGDTTTDNNYANAAPNARTAATANSVLGQAVQPSQVSVEIGSYTYNTTTNQFQILIPRDPTENWSLVRARVDRDSSASFARVFGITSFNTSAVAVGAHRPRDMALILDFSGSMRFDSLLGIPHTGNRIMSNNPETVFPLFGHYSDVATAALQNTNTSTTISGEIYGSSNAVVETTAGKAIVEDFYQHPTGSSAVRAFTPVADSQGYDVTPGGDNYLKTSGGAYGKTVNEITGGMPFQGYTNPPFLGYTGEPVVEFKGYTEGPRYWGKTFFVWPPDPRWEPGKYQDWRKRFFFHTDGVTPLNDNTKLWDSSGNFKPPRDSSGTNNYRINYNAILSWLRNNPSPFPNRLRCGRILYYDAIPNTINTASFPPADLNERFWKEYIDHVLGVKQTGGSGATPVYQVVTARTGYGNDFTWGTVQITAPPTSGSPPPYMNYADNPRRPKLHFWFGPMTMLDFLGNYNESRFWWPGTCHEAPLYTCKLGIQAALQDIQRNHPNDWVSMMMFSVPQYSAGGSGRFNEVRGPLGRSYQRMIDSLWFPPTTIDNPGTEIRPYDAGNNEAPRGMGGTCPAMGFMLAFNQYSGNASLRTHTPAPAPTGQAGGLGRRGAQKMIIFETDGMANTAAQAGITNLGANNSYYNIRQPGEYPSNSGAVTTQVYDIVDRIVALETDAIPGYSTVRKPVIIHCLAFGTLFEPYSSGDPDQAAALTLLQTIQYKGKTQSSPTTPLPSYKIVIGDNQQRLDLLQQAFTVIMQDGQQVGLIQ